MPSRTITEHIRQHLLDGAADTLAARRGSEWCLAFEELMRNRLLVGSYRYGRLARKRAKGVTMFHVVYILRKLEQYRVTGNTEMLVDVANLALVEFVVGDHPKKHFKAEDRE